MEADARSDVTEVELWSAGGGSFGIKLAPDGKSVAISVRAHRKLLWMERRAAFVLRDGELVGDVYDTLYWSTFSPDGSSLAFAAKSGDGWAMIRDGVPVGGYHDSVGRPVFSPDGKSLAFCAGTGPEGSPKYFIVKDGKQASETYHFAGDPVFSPDGKSLAFAARSGGKWFVVKDGEKVSEDYDLIVSRPVFSPDGLSLAFIAERRPEDAATQRGTVTKRFLVKDGVRVGEEYVFHEGGEGSLDTPGPVFSPDGRSLAFVAPVDLGQFVVRDGVRVSGDYGDYGQIAETLYFSPDGHSLAWVASRDTDYCIVVRDGVQVGGPLDIGAHPVYFSPDSKHVAFRISSRRGSAIAKDGIRITPFYDKISNIITSDDGTRMVFAASKGRTLYRVEVPWSDSPEAATARGEEQ